MAEYTNVRKFTFFDGPVRDGKIVYECKAETLEAAERRCERAGFRQERLGLAISFPPIERES